jgi:4'-phosphopantetheinyl transferase
MSPTSARWPRRCRVSWTRLWGGPERPCRRPAALFDEIDLPASIASAGLRLWRADLDRGVVDAQSACLSDQERQRASRLVFDHHRRRYLTSCVFTRRVLAHLLGAAPEQIRFDIGAEGKPALAGPSGLHFNLSHSEAVALLATGGSELGVDVEVLRTIEDSAMLSQRLYTARECQWIDCASPERQAERFLNCWTRKEACLKAVGSGFSIEPGTFFGGTGSDPSRVQLAWRGRPFDLAVHPLADPGGRWVGALALADPAVAGRMA